MRNTAYTQDEDFKVLGNWERFLKRFQDKFWKELNPASGPCSKEGELIKAKS
jgi:hypothetical protein